MTTLKELEERALGERRQLIDAGKDPWQHEFSCTADEHATIQMAPLMHVLLNVERDRFCGMRIKVTR